MDEEPNILMMEAIDVLAGQQAVDVHEFHKLLLGGDPFAISGEVHRALHWLLIDLGYDRRKVRSVKTGKRGFKYVRGPWPIDFAVLKRGKADTFYAID